VKPGIREKSHTALPTHRAVSNSTLSSESKPTLAKVVSGFASTMRDRVFQNGARYRLCLDRVRELSAPIRGSVLVFQGVGESPYKCLPEKERENFNYALFALAFLCWRQDRELPGAISRGLLDCPRSSRLCCVRDSPGDENSVQGENEFTKGRIRISD